MRFPLPTTRIGTTPARAAATAVAGQRSMPAAAGTAAHAVTANAIAPAVCAVPVGALSALARTTIRVTSAARTMPATV